MTEELTASLRQVDELMRVLDTIAKGHGKKQRRIKELERELAATSQRCAALEVLYARALLGLPAPPGIIE